MGPPQDSIATNPTAAVPGMETIPHESAITDKKGRVQMKADSKSAPATDEKPADANSDGDDWEDAGDAFRKDKVYVGSRSKLLIICLIACSTVPAVRV